MSTSKAISTIIQINIFKIRFAQIGQIVFFYLGALNRLDCCCLARELGCLTRDYQHSTRYYRTLVREFTSVAREFAQLAPDFTRLAPDFTRWCATLPVGARLLHFLARPHSAGMTPLRPYPLSKNKIVIEIGNCRFRALYYTSFISDFKSMATGFALL